LSSEWTKAQEKRFSNEPVIEEALANPIMRERIDTAVAMIGGPGLKVLDVGCGDGAISELIHNNGNENWAMDLPDVADTVPEARKAWLRVFHCDASKKPWFTLENTLFNDGAFDVVFAGEIIEHMIDIEPFLTEAHRVLKPGGRIVLTTPNAVRELNRIGMIFGNVHGWHQWDAIPHHIRFWTPDTLALALQKYGFKPTKIGTGRSQAEVNGYVEDIQELSPEEKRVLRRLFNRTMPTPVYRHSFIIMEAVRPES
jgi:2-polyprenyl-6-hydroxyphenyl methylase/3-demethylubiquinone-9 3-methyltransferase